MLIDSFTENVMEVLKSRLVSFAQSFSESNRITVKQAMTTIHVWKGTQPQHNHEFEVLNNMDDVLYNV